MAADFTSNLKPKVHLYPIAGLKGADAPTCSPEKFWMKVMLVELIIAT